MDTPIKKTSKPIAGGILNIITGAINILCFLGVIVTMLIFPTSWTTWYGNGIVTDIWVTGFVETILWIAAVFSFVAAILPLIGGIYALQRNKWGLALAGSIIAIIGFTPLGIAATVLIAISREEFE
jgi:hypothetical protein